MSERWCGVYSVDSRMQAQELVNLGNIHWDWPSLHNLYFLGVRCHPELETTCPRYDTSFISMWHSPTPPKGQQWNQQLLRQYQQLWAQLKITDGVLCRHYTPSPMAEAINSTHPLYCSS